MIFWFSLAFITLALCLVAFYPLLKKSPPSGDTKRDELNKAFYFDRLNEVQNELETGVIDNAEQSTHELQQNLLDDIPDTAEIAQAAPKPHHKMGFAAALLFVVAVSFGVYFSVGAWKANTMLATNHDKLAAFYARVEEASNAPLSPQEMAEFALALRVELQEHPQDHRAWFMLGQVGMASDNGQLALESFKKAAEIAPENEAYQVSLAQMLLYSADKTDQTQGEAILKDVLKSDPANLDALSLLAFRAFEQADYATAVTMWKTMLNTMPSDAPRYKTIERSVRMAEAMAGSQ